MIFVNGVGTGGVTTEHKCVYAYLPNLGMVYVL